MNKLQKVLRWKQLRKKLKTETSDGIGVSASGELKLPQKRKTTKRRSPLRKVFNRIRIAGKKPTGRWTLKKKPQGGIQKSELHPLIPRAEVALTKFYNNDAFEYQIERAGGHEVEGVEEKQVPILLSEPGNPANEMPNRTNFIATPPVVELQQFPQIQVPQQVLPPDLIQMLVELREEQKMILEILQKLSNPMMRADGGCMARPLSRRDLSFPLQPMMSWDLSSQESITPEQASSSSSEFLWVGGYEM